VGYKNEPRGQGPGALESTKSMPMWGRYQFARYSTVTDLARFLG